MNPLSVSFKQIAKTISNNTAYANTQMKRVPDSTLTDDGDFNEVLGAPSVYEAAVPGGGLELKVDVACVPHVVAR